MRRLGRNIGQARDIFFSSQTANESKLITMGVREVSGGGKGLQIRKKSYLNTVITRVCTKNNIAHTFQV